MNNWFNAAFVFYRTLNEELEVTILPLGTKIHNILQSSFDVINAFL